MSNLKKWIIMLIIMLIVIVGMLIYIISQNKGEVIYGVDEQGKDISYEIDKNVQNVSSRNKYYVVKNCVNKFYTYYASIYDVESENYILDAEAKASIESEQKKNAEAIYNLLDKEYINFKEITKDNILTKLQKINTSVVNITNMYISEQTDNISVYIVEGKLREKISGEISDFQLMLKLDLQNRTFTVFLQDYIDEKYKEGFKLGNELNINVSENIEKNENNIYEYETITDDTYVNDLLNKYREEVLYNSDLAYENLDEEYKNKRFETLERFQEYAKNNVRKHVIMQLDKYQKTITDDYTQYVCIDKGGNYYIFKETAVMDYSLILDTYTLDLPEFIEKYNNSKENEKILLNIQKVFDAINSGDYKYVYDKLDDTFKSNYFKTQNQFEKYIKENWYTNNNASYGEYQKNGDVYIYNIQITDGSKTETDVISQKIVMKLLEGTDFVMSFNVE